MTTHHKRSGGPGFHLKLTCALQQPVTGRKSIKEFWRTARMIGSCNADEPVDPLYLPGQSSHCAVRGICVMQGTGAEMAEHKGNHLVDQIALIRQSFQEASRRRLSLRFVTARHDASEVMGCGRRLSEVVAEDAEAHRQIVVVMAGALCGEPVQAMERVDPDIAFRVPDRILLTALQRCEFRVEAEPAAVAQKS